MARILFLTQLLPYPLVSGAKIRAYYVLRHLAARHDVSLLSFVRGDDRPEDVEHLAGFLDSVHTVPMKRSSLRNARALLVSLFSGRPAIIAREEISAMWRRAEELLAASPFEVVHADQLPMAQYGLLGQTTKARCLLDQHNATFQIIERLARQETNPYLRLFMAREARAFAQFEVAVCQRFDHVSFVTEEDRQSLLSLTEEKVGPSGREALQRRSTVIPICADTDSTHLVPPVRSPFRVTHVGTMFWPPNVEGVLWFHKQVWPRVRALWPDARLTLIGKSPPDEVRALSRQPQVDVLGYVEDLRTYLAETAVFVVPLHAGAGMRVKIVDAWCWGLPIVSTTIGAEGISVRDGENILLADGPQEFADAVVRLLEDTDLQTKVRSAGRRWVEEEYDWKQVYGAWDAVYSRLLKA